QSPGGVVRLFSDELTHVQALATDHTSVYAATRGRKTDNQRNGVVFRIPILTDGSAGAAIQIGPSDSVKQPVGLVRDRLGRLFLTTMELDLSQDVSKRAVAKLFLDGTLTAFAANFQKPEGLGFNSLGDLLVADGVSGRVIRFRAPPKPTL